MSVGVNGDILCVLLSMGRKSLPVGLFVSVCQLQGCATYLTNTIDPGQMAIDACQNKCDFLPHIYSGTVMDFCGGTASGGGQGGGMMLMDLPLSFIADTVILPYTAYKQINEGNISTKEKCRVAEEKEKSAREEKRKQLILEGR